MVLSGDGDHLGGEVDPERVDAEVVQMPGDVPRATADIGHRPVITHSLREHRQAGAQVRTIVQQAAYLLGIAGGIGVVRLAGLVQPVVGHRK
jgi:hypothetical protein